MDMLRITLEEIEARKTENGGWTKDTLAQWGVPWPPKKGWKADLIKRSLEAEDFAGDLKRQKPDGDQAKIEPSSARS